MNIRTIWLALLTPIALLAGLGSNTITVTASRTVYVQPDQAVFQVTLTSPSAITQDNVVAAFQGSGITVANLTGSPDSTVWSFPITVPLSSFNATVALLTGIQPTLAQKMLALAYLVGTQVSSQLQQAQACGPADLLADATDRAQKMANAAGLTLGPVLAMANVSQPVSY